MSDTCFFNADPSEGNFTVLNNTCIRDPRLSLKAKGLHTYFMSLPQDWKLYKSELTKHHTDGIDSINSAINELTQFGYVEVSEQKRNEDGKFTSKAYGFHAIPTVSDENNRRGFPVTAKPSTVQPLTENPLLLNTNILSTNILKTELTNSNSQTVSESVFVNLIKELFSGDYPFDKNFESDVMKRLESSQIETVNLEAFLKYVFERTKILNPSKSFEGLYRKLALSSSIATDFKLSFQNKKSESQESNKIAFRKINCSICGKEFNEIDYYCPTCGVSLKAINGEDKVEYQVHKKLFEMSPDEKQNYEQAYSTWEQQTKIKAGRPFLLSIEKIQFWKDYGILPEEN